MHESGCLGVAVLFHVLLLPCRAYDGTVLLELAANVMPMRLDADIRTMPLYRMSLSIAATFMSSIAAALAARRGHKNLRERV